MRNLFQNILIASVILSLAGAPVVVNAMPEPAPATQTDKQKAAAAKAKEKEKAAKAKEKEKAAKEKEKAAAAKAKEKEKAAKEKEKAAAAKAKEKEKAAAAKEKEQAAKEKEKAAAAKAKEKEQEAAAKEKEKAAAEKEKAAAAKAKEAEKKQAERAKIAAEKAEAQAKKEAAIREQEEKALREYEKYQERLENPKTEAISYINLGLRAGYSAMMDKLNGAYMGAGTLNTSNALQQLKGGGGAGLNLTYNLEYGHFLFETGLDFRFLNSTSCYGFNAIRQDLTYGATYTYLFDNTTEMRNMLEVGLPLMFGAQFNKFYFLVGAKVHYGLPMGYTQKGLYDIVINDPALLEPYGGGIHELNGQTNQAISFKQPDVSVAAEIGIDLDQWLQKQPTDEYKKLKIREGERMPFGRQHVHYRVGLFAEYGVLNTNATPAANPVEFASNNMLVQNSNTFLAWGGDTKLNNLFVGAKFTIQFEIPGKTDRPVPPPPSTAIIHIINAETEEVMTTAFMEIHNTENGRVVQREKQITKKEVTQKLPLGSFQAKVRADGFYPTSQSILVDKVGSKQDVVIALQPRPVLRVRVTNKETGMVVPATVQILADNKPEPAYSLTTDSLSGTTKQRLEEGPSYRLHIAQMGYDTLDMAISNIGDSLNVELEPIKKGEIFIVKNLFFATNKTRILSSSEEALNDLYMYLARNPQVRIKIIGHTDSVGKDAANQKLSDGRANEVMKDLIERGISADRLQAEGRGESQPIDTNDTEEGRQNNRRVEIEIL